MSRNTVHKILHKSFTYHVSDQLHEAQLEKEIKQYTRSRSDHQKFFFFIAIKILQNKIFVFIAVFRQPIQN